MSGNRNSRWLSLALASVTLAGTMLYLLKQASSSAPFDSGVSAGEAAKQGAPRVVGCRLSEGLAAAYRVELVTAAGAGADSVKNRFGLSFSVLTSDAHSSRLAMSIGLLDLAVPPGSMSSALEEAATTSFGLQLDSTCGISEYGFPRAWSAQTRLTLRSVLSHFDVRLASSKTWEREQADASGIYNAHYSRSDDNEVQKRSFGYRRLHLAMQLGAAPSLSGLTKATFVESGWLDSLRSEVKYELSLLAGKRVSVSTQLNVSRLRETPPPSVLGDSVQWQSAITPMALPSAKKQDPVAQDTDPLSALVTFLRDTRAADILVVNTSAKRLSAVLRSSPEAVDEVLRALLDGQRVPDDQRPGLFFALELAGTPEVQRVLGTLLNDTGVSTADKVRAIHALTRVEEPTAQALSSLVSLASSPIAYDDPSTTVARSAVLALGTLASSAPGGVGEEARSAAQRVIESSFAAEEYTLALGAIGNSGEASYQSAVVRYLEHPEARVRGYAARAARDMDAEFAATTLTRRLNQEPSAEVRTELASVLIATAKRTNSEPSAETCRVAASLVHSETGSAAQQALVQLLGMAPSNVEAREALRSLYTSTSSPELKTLVGRFLTVDELQSARPHSP